MRNHEKYTYIYVQEKNSLIHLCAHIVLNGVFQVHIFGTSF
jgi:hypothetical protein